jgi:hypothetical protein
MNADKSNKKIKEISCPCCYGGHFKPCQACSDSGIANLIEEDELVSKLGKRVDIE